MTPDSIAAMEQRVRIGVYGVAVDDGSILLTQLWDRDPAPGFWTLPGGGLEFGEDPRQGLIREFVEETGLVPTIGNLVDVHSYTRDQFQAIQIIFAVHAAGMPQVLERGGSTTDARWVPFDEIDPLPTVTMVYRVQALNGW